MSPKPPKKASKQHKSSSRKRKRGRGSPDTAAATLKLLAHAALGKTRRVRKLLDRTPGLDVSAFDAEGLTPLHHACRYGHLATAQLLLKCVLACWP